MYLDIVFYLFWIWNGRQSTNNGNGCIKTSCCAFLWNIIPSTNGRLGEWGMHRTVYSTNDRTYGLTTTEFWITTKYNDSSVWIMTEILDIVCEREEKNYIYGCRRLDKWRKKKRNKATNEVGLVMVSNTLHQHEYLEFLWICYLTVSTINCRKKCEVMTIAKVMEVNSYICIIDLAFIQVPCS